MLLLYHAHTEPRRAQESTYRRSLAQKSKRTAMDNNYMMAVLKAFRQA
ncbi:hypothetical protein D3800_18400 [Microcystis aeruginosa NIES-298]|nr:hypothetical protein [Microcystis aeruginosa]QHU85112.1 hypothetical protein D3800_18400 [Microcystis aeruginosa NIES-298]